MSKSRRRKKRGQRPPRYRDELRDNLPLLQVVDEAERRGDAEEALRLIHQDRQRRERRGETAPFWRPERVTRLAQIVLLGPLLPRWAVSRWILAQALQWLDPRSGRRNSRAVEIAKQTRADLPTRWASGPRDADCKVMDHDWVYRQVLLFDLGTIHQFLARAAPADLVAGADRIHDWARAPMGGYRLLDCTPLVLTWSDLDTGRQIETTNLGAAALLEPNDCVLGRMVPIADGEMFESAPLFVPEPVARQVAGDPAGWVEHLAAGCREPQPDGRGISTDHGHDFDLLVDIPAAMVVLRASGVLHGRFDFDEGDGLALLRELVVAALDGTLDDADAPDTVEAWPAVSAALLEPAVLAALSDVLSPDDALGLRGLADRLPAPAAQVCRAIEREMRASA